MESATRNTKPDVRRNLTCAALATVTTIGMFSLIANFMTPVFAGLSLVTGVETAQETRAVAQPVDDRPCVQTVHVDEAGETQKPSAI